MITLNEVKQSLGITFNSQDDYLNLLLLGVLNDAENVTGYNFTDPSNEAYIELSNGDLSDTDSNPITAMSTDHMSGAIRLAVLQQIDFLYSKRGDLDNKRNDSFYLVLRRFSKHGKIFF